VTITTARARRGDCKTFAFNAIRADLEGLRRMFPCIRGLLVRCVHLGSAACVPATVEPLHEATVPPQNPLSVSPTGWNGYNGRVIVAASTVAVVAIAAAVIAVALVLWYVLPRGGRRRRPPRT
jgi:hypothetical protein